MKKPWLAALLNIFLFGAGYVYNGKQKRFGYWLLASSILIFPWSVLMPVPEVMAWYDWLMFVGLLVFIVATGSDAYREAKEINAKRA